MNEIKSYILKYLCDQNSYIKKKSFIINITEWVSIPMYKEFYKETEYLLIS